MADCFCGERATFCWPGDDDPTLCEICAAESMCDCCTRPALLARAMQVTADRRQLERDMKLRPGKRPQAVQP